MEKSKSPIMNSSPLQHFLFQEIFLGLSHPLFSSQKDFMELAVTVRGISWYGKKPENLKPIMSTQMKKRGEPGAVQIVRHHGLYIASTCKYLVTKIVMIVLVGENIPSFRTKQQYQARIHMA